MTRNPVIFISEDPSRPSTAEYVNWSGKLFRITCEQAKNGLLTEPTLNRPGVCLLYNPQKKKITVFIGESEDVLKRLKRLLSPPSRWKEAIIFISKDDLLNKADVKFLKYHLYSMVEKSHRYTCRNKVRPGEPSLTKTEKADLKESLTYIEKLIPQFSPYQF